MEDEILTIDNVVPSYFADMIEQIIFKHFPFVFGMSNSTSDVGPILEKYDKRKIYEQFQQSAPLISEGILSRGLDKFLSILTTPLVLGLAKTNLVPIQKNIQRCKVNIQTKSYENVENKYNFPHVDNIDNQNMVTAIYYVNDTDGDTFIFNEKLDKGRMMDISEIDNLTIKKRISPKKGRLLMFPSSYVHAGIHPQNNMFRSVINYNYQL